MRKVAAEANRARHLNLLQLGQDELEVPIPVTKDSTVQADEDTVGHAPVTPPTAQGRAPETPPKVAPVRHEALAADAMQVEKSGWWQHVVDSSEPHIQPQPPLQADLDMAAGEQTMQKERC